MVVDFPQVLCAPLLHSSCAFERMLPDMEGPGTLPPVGCLSRIRYAPQLGLLAHSFYTMTPLDRFKDVTICRWMWLGSWRDMNGGSSFICSLEACPSLVAHYRQVSGDTGGNNSYNRCDLSSTWNDYCTSSRSLPEPLDKGTAAPIFHCTQKRLHLTHS